MVLVLPGPRLQTDTLCGGEFGEFHFEKGTAVSQPGPACAVPPLQEVSSPFLEVFQRRPGECGVGLHGGCEC